jgi:hypothetical protein
VLGKNMPPSTRGADGEHNLREKRAIAPPVLGKRSGRNGRSVENQVRTFYPCQNEKEQFSEGLWRGRASMLHQRAVKRRRIAWRS